MSRRLVLRRVCPTATLFLSSLRGRYQEGSHWIALHYDAMCWVVNHLHDMAFGISECSLSSQSRDEKLRLPCFNPCSAHNLTSLFLLTLILQDTLNHKLFLGQDFLKLFFIFTCTHFYYFSYDYEAGTGITGSLSKICRTHLSNPIFARTSSLRIEAASLCLRQV